MGRDVIATRGDRAQIRLSCPLGDRVSFYYELKFEMKHSKSGYPRHVYYRATSSGNLGANVDDMYYADTYTANGLEYKKWNVYQATLYLALTYNGVTVEREFLIRFE